MDRVLLIDDDKELCALLTEYLAPEGLAVEPCHTGGQGLARALSGDYDAALLDVALPDTSGFDVLGTIRSRSALPVLMLTGRGDDVDRIVGLEMGADDYVPKPFVPRELLARLRAVLRRTRTHGTAAGAAGLGGAVGGVGPYRKRNLSFGASPWTARPARPCVTARPCPLPRWNTPFSCCCWRPKAAPSRARTFRAGCWDARYCPSTGP